MSHGRDQGKRGDTVCSCHFLVKHKIITSKLLYNFEGENKIKIISGKKWSFKKKKKKKI